VSRSEERDAEETDEDITEGGMASGQRRFDLSGRAIPSMEKINQDQCDVFGE